MSQENFLWGAPRIHGELLKLGFVVSQATVSRYMPRRGKLREKAMPPCRLPPYRLGIGRPPGRRHQYSMI
jgi:hypothetical protein